MKLLQIGVILATMLTLGACSSPEIATRNMPIDVPALQAGDVTLERDYALAGIQVIVSPDLRVSEGNGYYPLVDIVWRGDPVGDRRAQIAAMFTEAAERSIMPAAEGQRPVIAQVVLRRFHGVTERTRFSVGGTYSIKFDLTIVDATTGAVIEEARYIEADLAAPGGQAALELERAGQTERVRVTDHLTWVLRQQLELAIAI